MTKEEFLKQLDEKLKENGVENPDKSRRVEFRIRTKAEDTMDELIKDRFE